MYDLYSCCPIEAHVAHFCAGNGLRAQFMCDEFVVLAFHVPLALIPPSPGCHIGAQDIQIAVKRLDRAFDIALRLLREKAWEDHQMINDGSG